MHSKLECPQRHCWSEQCEKHIASSKYYCSHECQKFYWGKNYSKVDPLSKDYLEQRINKLKGKIISSIDTTIIK